MKKWRIYFEQINQTYLDVEARTEDSARLKAEREWREENPPRIISSHQFDIEAKKIK